MCAVLWSRARLNICISKCCRRRKLVEPSPSTSLIYTCGIRYHEYMDETVKQKLKEYLDAGKPYQEATNLLLAQKFTRLQIEDAKIALNSHATQQDKPKIDINAHPELASSLLQATDTMAPTREKVEPPETNAMFTTNGGLVYHSKIKGNIYLLFIGAMVILIALIVLVKYILK